MLSEHYRLLGSIATATEEVAASFGTCDDTDIDVLLAVQLMASDAADMAFGSTEAYVLVQKALAYLMTRRSYLLPKRIVVGAKAYFEQFSAYIEPEQALIEASSHLRFSHKQYMVTGSTEFGAAFLTTASILLLCLFYMYPAMERRHKEALALDEEAGA